MDKLKQSYKEKHKLDDLLSSTTPPEFVQLNCPSCGTTVSASNVDLSSQLGKCDQCNAVFSVSEDIRALLSQGQPKSSVVKPVGVDIFHFQDELEISIAQPINYLDLIFGLIIIAVFFMSLIYFKGYIPDIVLITAWLLNLFPMYYFFNRGQARLLINVDRGRLHLRNRPKNLSKDKSWPVEQIDQIYCGHADMGGLAVKMIVNGPEGQKHVTLVNAVSGISKGRYVEQEIETYLNITDRSLPEEHIVKATPNP